MVASEGLRSTLWRSKFQKFSGGAPRLAPLEYCVLYTYPPISTLCPPFFCPCTLHYLELVPTWSQADLRAPWNGIAFVVTEGGRPIWTSSNFDWPLKRRWLGHLLIHPHYTSTSPLLSPNISRTYIPGSPHVSTKVWQTLMFQLGGEYLWGHPLSSYIPDCN